MDVLDEVLQSVGLRAALYFRTELSAPWGIRVPAYARVARFHIVAHGRFWVSVPNQVEPTEVFPGDIVLVPHGREHIIADAQTSKVTLLDDVLASAEHREGELLRNGAGGLMTNLICGHFEFERGSDHPLLVTLPALMVLRKPEAQEVSWLAAALSLVDQEARGHAPGRSAVIQRLAEIIFIQVVRAYLAEGDKAPLFLRALSDAQIRRALERVHEQPAVDWTVDLLARAAGMSRTVFAERFVVLTGLTPMQYVTHWRMQRAAALLKDPGRSVPEVAQDVGYRAPEAFQKAFKKALGVTPASFRKHAPELE